MFFWARARVVFDTELGRWTSSRFRHFSPYLPTYYIHRSIGQRKNWVFPTISTPHSRRVYLESPFPLIWNLQQQADERTEQLTTIDSALVKLRSTPARAWRRPPTLPCTSKSRRWDTLAHIRSMYVGMYTSRVPWPRRRVSFTYVEEDFKRF